LNTENHCSKRPRRRGRVVLLGDWLPVQRPSSRRCIARIWVSRSRFAVGPRPGCAVFHRRFGPLTVKRAAAISRRASASLWSFAQQLPVRPPQRTDTSHGLSFPSARADFGDRLFVPGDSQSPSASACRVCLPSWRFHPAETGPVLFHTGSAHGIRPSELSPPATVPGAFPPERTHVPIVRPVHNAAQGSEAGPDDRGFWALTRAGVPCGRRVISTPTAGCSLGLFPFQGLRATSLAERPRRPLTCLSQFGKAEQDGTSEFCISSLGSIQSRAQGMVGSNSLLRVSAPVRSEAFEN
jgi:hypothetical protein